MATDRTDTRLPKRGRRGGYGFAAELTGIPAGTLRYLVSKKKIPHYRIGPRSVLFVDFELERWLASRAVAVAVVA